MSAIAPRRLVLYEDRHWRTLRPMTDLLPVPALTFGASDLARRWPIARVQPASLRWFGFAGGLVEHGHDAALDGPFC